MAEAKTTQPHNADDTVLVLLVRSLALSLSFSVCIYWCGDVPMVCHYDSRLVWPACQRRAHGRCSDSSERKTRDTPLARPTATD